MSCSIELLENKQKINDMYTEYADAINEVCDKNNKLEEQLKPAILHITSHERENAKNNIEGDKVHIGDVKVRVRKTVKINKAECVETHKVEKLKAQEGITGKTNKVESANSLNVESNMIHKVKNIGSFQNITTIITERKNKNNDLECWYFKNGNCRYGDRCRKTHRYVQKRYTNKISQNNSRSNYYMVQTKYKSYREKNIYREANQYPVETNKYRRGVIENGIYKGRNENVEDEMIQKKLYFRGEKCNTNNQIYEHKSNNIAENNNTDENVLSKNQVINISKVEKKVPNINKNIIRIAGLNVYGLESKFRDGQLEEFIENFHIVCLTETKTDTPDLSNTSLNDYSCFAKKKKLK